MNWLALTVILLLVKLGTIDAQDYLTSTYPASVIEDGHLDTAQLVRKYKYPAETHYVTTSDQYILAMHRIANPEGRPVFLMHGLLDSSASWVMMGPWSGLGYYLHDLGYDVWMGNARGNRYSRNHTLLDPETDVTFWTFSWHEIGIHDLPAMIDYVLNATGHPRLHYFGHSQGTTSFWVMASMRPEYNAKISIMSALAPVAFMRNVKTPLKGTGKNLSNMSKEILRELPYTSLVEQFCFRSPVTDSTCLETFWLIMGKDPQELNTTMLPVMWGHLPAGANLKQALHYIQLIDSDRFAQYDYGPIENVKRYSRPTPPDYPLDKITAPVGLYYAFNDFLSSEVDVRRLAKLLPNVVENHPFANKKWNHVSMIWGITAREQAHKHMIEVMRKFE